MHIHTYLDPCPSLKSEDFFDLFLKPQVDYLTRERDAAIHAYEVFHANKDPQDTLGTAVPMTIDQLESIGGVSATVRGNPEHDETPQHHHQPGGEEDSLALAVGSTGETSEDDEEEGNKDDKGKDDGNDGDNNNKGKDIYHDNMGNSPDIILADLPQMKFKETARQGVFLQYPESSSVPPTQWDQTGPASQEKVFNSFQSSWKNGLETVQVTGHRQAANWMPDTTTILGILRHLPLPQKLEENINPHIMNTLHLEDPKLWWRMRMIQLFLDINYQKEYSEYPTFTGELPTAALH
ncbi:hypothetical protein BS47DRAFT_1434176 [Hydnum rufescens UP504]|uniref:Uncharacterized protein n=1 Tax=Hydnum rufescens UP504 TaxID=1448309 RepID=A0A9P6DPA9_9AGAM|nr:hypothetical protein BS47DRAFT_1434176 [Hydnum rufescens UP504]